MQVAYRSWGHSKVGEVRTWEGADLHDVLLLDDVTLLDLGVTGPGLNHALNGRGLLGWRQSLVVLEAQADAGGQIIASGTPPEEVTKPRS
ncbi:MULTISPECIES: hypothetical protein [unclassified Streptomyces]|uniref:hypothetical protein n=1 Tax=unclassified Streptomyces TaxID=2593676 RepID=UPI002DD8C944|nr:hypothetical protein [Streptomyces sp. NBC_01750]WSB01894.1 hypothetical protein OIE54_22945 [Streptomyces sp. NBC_01794]WSD33836.1 hypothetical protein OG966_19165 [Streptomyces sp. NBC_01750]